MKYVREIFDKLCKKFHFLCCTRGKHKAVVVCEYDSCSIDQKCKHCGKEL